MFRLAARSFVRRASSQVNRATRTNRVPYYTVGACAVTSAAMYGFFSARIHAESTESVDAPVVLIEEVAVDTETGAVVDDLVIENKDGEVVAEIVEVRAPADEEAVIEAVAEVVEEEAVQQGAYNEETGEINWDCPCLGGMAEGPCGEEFKAAFSCFIYSQEEPKGVECIDKFKDMQNCFRKYPEVYSDELRDEEELERATNQAAMNNDIIESIEEAKDEAKQLAYDIYGAAQKKIDDFHSKK